MDDFGKYEKMRNAGSGPKEVYLAAKADGLDQISRIRLIRQVFNLSLVEAKEVVVVAENWAPSLAAHQEKVIPAAQAFLDPSADGAPASAETPSAKK